MIIVCISVLYLGGILGALISGLFGAVNILQDIVVNSNLWATLIFAVIMAPIVEELIFRRAIINRLRKYGDRTAILVSAMLFALMHGNLSQLFYSFGLGVLFGYVYTRTGKLRYSIGLHMIVNFLGSFIGSLIIDFLNSIDLDALSKVNPFDTEAVFEIVGEHAGQFVAIGFIALIGLVIAGLILLIVRWKRAVLLEGAVLIPKGRRAGAIFGNAGMICYIVLSVVALMGSLLIGRL